jgi:guanine deaminase
MIVRGRLLSFLRAPHSAEDHEAYRYIEDGAIIVRDGRIASIGAFCELDFRDEVIDHRPHLILPGFIDPHLHFPQVQVIGSYAADLLEWLEDYTFPAEIAFENAEHAARMSNAFYDELLRNGTTTAAAFCSSHNASVAAYFEAAQARGMCAIGGKVMMDRGAPEALCDTAQTGYDDSKAMISRWHGQGRAHYAISPRFAITSTPEQLAAAGALAAEHPACFIQTHMNETRSEIEAVARLYPNAEDYLAVYEAHGLVRDNSLMGHCIHMSESQTARMAEKGAVAVHCPTSNLFLGSGRFDYFGLTHAGVKAAVATDIGGGTSYSMLQTLDAAYKIQQMRRERLNPLLSMYWATRGNAECLGLEGEIGTLDAGSMADFVVLNAAATPVGALRMETVETLDEELFLLQTIGDDRSVVETYVAGQASKPVN